MDRSRRMNIMPLDSWGGRRDRNGGVQQLRDSIECNMILNGSTYFIQDELAYYNGKFMSVINIWNESGPQLNAPLISEGNYLFGSHVLGNSSLPPLNARLFEEVHSNGSSYYLVIGVNSSIGDWKTSTRLPSDAWFMVDGGRLTPFGNLYDAELVVGGGLVTPALPNSPPPQLIYRCL